MYKIKNLFVISSLLKQYVRHVSLKTKPNSSKYVSADTPPTVNFFSKALGLPTLRTSRMLEKNTKLHDVNRNDLSNTINLLKSLKYTAEEIETRPMILYLNSLTLENRYNILKECGCNEISISTLFRYVTVLNRDISMLKMHNIIPENIDVQKHLEDCFASDIKIKLGEKLGEDILIKTVREKILNAYLKEKLKMNENDLEKQWKMYGRIRNKSFHSIIMMIKILIEKLNFSIDRIKLHKYLLYGDPDNLDLLINNIHKIDTEDFKEILYRRPKIIMSSYESINKIMKYINKFGIPENSILKCLEILTLSSETVLERLNDIKNREELQPLLSNPRILKLVHFQNKAIERLDYLSNMKIKNASLHILSCDSPAFIRYAREGTDRNKGKDIVYYLANTFKVKEEDIRKELQKHPNWCHVSILQIKDCLSFLNKKLFSTSDIYDNIHILLYPNSKIEEKLKIILNDEFYKESQLDITYNHLSYKNTLALCLYLLEAEFHFTGDGIWTDQHSHNVENFSNFLPNFLEITRNDYKYNRKPVPDITTSAAVV